MKHLPGLRWLPGLLAALALGAQVQAQEPGCAFRIAKLKYGGGGDWYANPSSLPNLLRFVRQNTALPVCAEAETVEPGSPAVFQYPLIYLTGHGNLELAPAEVANLRAWMLAGGFLVLDDNYGMHRYARREIAKLFPEHELRPLPANHPVFAGPFAFPEGLPKVHAHDAKPAQAFGITHEGRLLLLLTFESDLGDGWEDPAVHNNPEAIRLAALRMGANLLHYAALKPR